ncbi:ABC-three component system protein [Pseudoalteromonas rubra]|uniref:ABC-three component system protein n=1 Tax=Pseudoalteromonas rubra TaxID=43658 RepID=UPI000F7756CB|nr:ABC-three component system protein [Pseudoalteromonas rubra]
MSVLDSNKASLDNVSARGHVSGRDVHDHSTHITHNHVAPVMYRQDHRLRELVEEHEQEIQKDELYKDFSSQLNNFLERKVEGKLRDLGQKLTDGSRDYLLDYAMDVKERVSKKIMQFSHYRSAQELYTYILTNIRTTFLHEISSRIKSGDFKDYEINGLVEDKIIQPVLESVNGCSLNIDKDELYGLLYILTGNCYIEWD